jgi:2-polyprenyl-3-methyl-5-hydroxy-6-metoxy-1,4-benzoquinol methylase
MGYFCAIMAGKIFTTEVTSSSLPADNPLHQRLLKPYVLTQAFLTGRENLLEVGCGEGRGVDLLLPRVAQFTAVDKLTQAIETLSRRYPAARFMAHSFPPLDVLEANAYDVVVSFQVIEHIQNDRFFLEEIYRVLKPGGLALLTTPNRMKTLTRNPWHVREYLADELRALAAGVFDAVEVKGITGNEKVMMYYHRNKAAVERLTRWDVLNLQHRLPAWMLKLPYELLNRLNRNLLRRRNNELVDTISTDDYLLVAEADEALDLFLTARKKS